MLLFGDAGLLPALVATVVIGAGVTSTTTLFIELHKSKGDQKGNLIINVLIRVLKAPLLVSVAFGLTLSFIGIQIPRPAAVFCETLGKSAGPCALFAIGLFMSSKSISSGTKEVFWMTGIKLVFHPLITAWLAFKIFTLDQKLASACVILSAMPTGSLVFVLAHKYKLYVHRATSIIFISTVASLVTLTLLFVVLGLS